jgi:hypothetical protein
MGGALKGDAGQVLCWAPRQRSVFVALLLIGQEENPRGPQAAVDHFHRHFVPKTPTTLRFAQTTPVWEARILIPVSTVSISSASTILLTSLRFLRQIPGKPAGSGITYTLRPIVLKPHLPLPITCLTITKESGPLQAESTEIARSEPALRWRP